MSYNPRIIPIVEKWLKLKREEIIKRFYSLPGSFCTGTNSRQFVFVKGTRPDKALLVAHADSVWGSLNIGIDFKDGVFHSSKKEVEVTWQSKTTKYVKKGIGTNADDHAGCLAVWSLRDLGHSMLITSGEEIGCVASRSLMENKAWRECIADHQFAIEFDRSGNNDIVFYDVGTNDFVKYMEKETGYKTQEGSSTDIRFLCKDICGVNISMGYYDEHTKDERLVLSELMRTVETARKLLSQKDLPKFPLIKGQTYVHEPVCAQAQIDKSFRCHKQSKKNNLTNLPMDLKNLPKEEIITCTHCKTDIPEKTWYANMFQCPKCNKPIDI